MTDIQSEKPCPVQTAQGFSVIYKNRFLYSKYAPQKAVLQAVESLQLLPGTFILCCSPCAGYALHELLLKLPKDCFVLCVENDESLYNFSLQQALVRNAFSDPDFSFAPPDMLSQLPLMLNSRSVSLPDGKFIPDPGTFRRVIRVDFSAGVQFNPQFYASLDTACENAVGQFWKNRVTLVRLGRRYARNIFRNTASLPRSLPFASVCKSVSKPVVVLGAGQSMEKTARFLKNHKGIFYIIAADAALPALKKFGIYADAAVCEEAQSAIAPAFLGAADNVGIIFAGITSWPGLSRTMISKLCYFSTRYADTVFFSRLESSEILTHVFPPLGSVGLTAVETALCIRKNSSVPVFVSGLDFSYTAGTTHARGTPAHISRLVSNSRLTPVQNYGSAFSYGTVQKEGKNGSTIFTTPALMQYAESFKDSFRLTENIFDTGTTGIELGISRADISSYSRKEAGCCNNKNSISAVSAEKIESFYNEEEKALNEIKELLSHGQNISETERNSRLNELLICREYLYLHFPDGYRLSLETQFLKRIRAEIDFFLKDISIGRKILSAY